MNTGGPAFPVPVTDATDGRTHDEGMTLLDWMAGQALMGSLASQSKESHWAFAPVEYETADDRAAKGIAELCYGIASAMLSEKARREADHSGDANKMVPDQFAETTLRRLAVDALPEDIKDAADEQTLGWCAEQVRARVNTLESINRELVEALESLDVWGDELDGNLCPPDSNCSCHISPPWIDCTNFAGQREAKRGWEDAQKRARAALSKAKGVA